MRCSHKTFLYLLIIVACIVIYTTLKDVRKAKTSVIDSKIQDLEDKIDKISERLDEIQTLRMKYILQWTSHRGVPFVYMGVGRQGFIERNCSFTNCIVTGNRSYLGDYTKFDVIAFSGPEVVKLSSSSLPDRRSLSQKYAFASIESSDNYPVCSDKLDNFFNWTWTYKVTSDARWGYMVIRDSKKKIIGPNVIMHWMKLEEMDPVSEKIKHKLKTKTKAAAWFVSNCYSRSGREKFVKELKEKLDKYKLSVDVYGRCGTLSCPPERHGECVKMLETDYYFYLSFENSFAEDYVTEKLLHAVENSAVPIVYGGANYTRFMPDGMYLNARELGAEKLAEKMNELILNPDLYAEYFRWKNHYSYHRKHEDIETDEYCRFCSMLNEKELVEKVSTYPYFRQWWDPPNRC